MSKDLYRRQRQLFYLEKIAVIADKTQNLEIDDNDDIAQAIEDIQKICKKLKRY